MTTTAIFDRAYEALHMPDSALAPIQSAGVAKLRALGLPTGRSEAWRNFSLGYLKDRPFSARTGVEQSAKPLATDHPSLVFVGGIFQPQLSTLIKDGAQGVEVQLVKDCTADQLSRLKTLMEAPPENDYQRKDATRTFQAALAETFLREGVWLKATERGAAPVIDIVTIAQGSTAGGAAIAGFPQLFTEVMEGCQLELRQICVDDLSAAQGTPREEQRGVVSEPSAISAPAFFGHVAKGAILRHYLIQRESAGVLHLGKTLITVEADGQFDGFHLLQGHGRCRQEADIVMAGPHAEIQLNGLYLAEDGSRIDNDTRIHHASGSTDSRQFYKGVIWDGGQGSFSGQIVVARDSQQVDAHQLNHNLLMGDKAVAHTRPQLAIDADDVKCSHGATVGSLKGDELFYLRSRGIPKDRAVRMLTLAFCRDVIERVQSPAAKEWLMMELGYSRLF